VREAAAPATARLNERLLQRLRRDDPAVDRLAVWDARHASELLRRSDYNLDNREVREYFPFQAVHDGILGVMAELFEVEIRPAKLPVWHPSVTSYEMRENGRTLGRFYLDLHPRPAKFQHAAAFLIRPALAGRQPPEVILVTNFPGDSAGKEGLLELDDVDAFFHEFGHLVHVMFAQQQYVYLQRPAEFDFTEAPSNMLEEFVRTPRVLQRLSRHVATGRPIPDSLIARIESADAFGRPRWAAQQSAYAAISLELHSHPADSIKVDSVTYRAMTDYTGLLVPQPVHFATAFDHLGSGYYAATYYTYLWSQVISKDLWSEFDPARPIARGPARRYRDLVLRPGGMKPAGQLVTEFLGRPFSFGSWQRWLQDEEIASVKD
jgi:thimet oligopeptidase